MVESEKAKGGERGGEERQMKEEWRGRSRGLGSGRGGWGKKNEEKGGRGIGKRGRKGRRMRERGCGRK